MKEICIPPRAQAVAMFGVLSGIVALVVSQLPEIRRYLKMRSM